MGLVVPEAYVSTVDAYSQMLKADSEWRRCSEGWEAGGRSYLPILAGPTIAEISERQEALMAELYKAVVGGNLALFAYSGGKLLRIYLDGIGRDQRRVGEGDARTETELMLTGKIRAGKVDSSERQEIDGAALCFRQADWCAWLAAHSEGAPATVSTVATEAPPRPGAGNTSYKDAELVEHVLALVDNETHKSVRAAARSIMTTIPGHGSPESKARRLADKARAADRARLRV